MNSVEAPRRSTRLNCKLRRHIHFEELEMLPRKRRKYDNNSAKVNTMTSNNKRKFKSKSFI